MTSRYWKASPELAEKIIKLLREREEIVKKGREWGKSIGASPDKMFYTNTSSGTEVSGFGFPEDKPPKNWCRLKNTIDGWRPKAGTKDYKEIRKFVCNIFITVNKLIGFNSLGPVSRGLGFGIRNIGVFDKDGEVFMCIPDDCTPKDCTRITDVEYETASEEVKPTKRKRPTVRRRR